MPRISSLMREEVLLGALAIYDRDLRERGNAICRELGWTDVQLNALREAAGSGEFSEREKVAIHLAEVMTPDAHSYSEVEFARLRSFQRG